VDNQVKALKLECAGKVEFLKFWVSFWS